MPALVEDDDPAMGLIPARVNATVADSSGLIVSTAGLAYPTAGSTNRVAGMWVTAPTNAEPSTSTNI